MAAPCASCHHPERVELDRALALGQESMRSLAKRYGIDRASLARHRQNHLSKALVRLQTEREEAGPKSALERYEELYAVVSRAVYGAENLPVPLVRELRGVLDSIARIRHELDDRPQMAVVNLSTDPEWARIRAVLMCALAPYPEAAQAVADALAGTTPPDTGSLGGLRSRSLPTPAGRL